MLLLDTHILIWLAAEKDHPHLSVKTKKEIEDAASVAVSAMTAFEIGLLVSKNRVALAPDFYRKALAFHGLMEIPVTGEIAERSILLPDLHRDPVDRILVATAMIHNLTIITRDRQIARYSVPVIEA